MNTNIVTEHGINVIEGIGSVTECCAVALLYACANSAWVACVIVDREPNDTSVTLANKAKAYMVTHRQDEIKGYECVQDEVAIRSNNDVIMRVT